MKLEESRYIRDLMLILTFFSTSCMRNVGREQNDSQLQHFFENSIRRDATAEENKQVLRLPGCTAFFLENTRRVAMVASAMHCFAFKPEDFCSRGGEFKTNDDQTGHCIEIVAAYTKHDTVVMEVALPFIPSPEHTLRLAVFPPAVRTPLKMIGYPADAERQGRLTVTDHCWVLKDEVVSVNRQHGLTNLVALHNCSTYGGNSGGPMMIEGTRVVVGLPSSFLPADFTKYPADLLFTAADIVRMVDFIERHRPELDAAGIVLAHP